MTHPFEQVVSGRWPSGAAKSLLLLRSLPPALVSRYDLSFAQGNDELGATLEAGLQLASGRFVLLISYVESPVAGTEVQVDSADNPGEAFTDVMGALALRADDVLWVRDDVHGGTSTT